MSKKFLQKKHEFQTISKDFKKMLLYTRKHWSMKRPQGALQSNSVMYESDLSLIKMHSH